MLAVPIDSTAVALSRGEVWTLAGALFTLATSLFVIGARAGRILSAIERVEKIAGETASGLALLAVKVATVERNQDEYGRVFRQHVLDDEKNFGRLDDMIMSLFTMLPILVLNKPIPEKLIEDVKKAASPRERKRRVEGDPND